MERVPDNKEFRLKEAAEALGVCRSTLEKYRNQGHIRTSFRVTTKKPYILGREINKMNK